MDVQVDQWLFGWDPLPGIVSVWAGRDGRAVVWQRLHDAIVCTRDRFRPWIMATTLADLAHLGSDLVPAGQEGGLIQYREMDGPAGGYRYLLSARPGYALDRAILQGASRRLGRAVTHLRALDDYYGVGPTEQYLMQTGRVYFRGLEYDDLHRLQFDLETTALDPHAGRIFMVAVRDNRGLATVLEAPAPEDEPRLITDLCALIRERDPDVIENHNLHGFDLPFVVERARRLRLRLRLAREGGPPDLEQYADSRGKSANGERRMRWSIPGRELIDTLDAVRRYDFSARDLPSHGLKAVARHFGLAAADRVELPGAQIYATYCSDPARVLQYALQDVEEVDGLSRRLLGAPFALAGMAPRRYERVASAGPAMGILEPLLVRAYLRAGAALPCEKQSVLAPHAGGATLLFATGIAQQVVKADVASLYPSLMRRYQIGPACDRLGVLLGILDRLIDLRLLHKAAARTATPDSLLAGRHHGMQAAMKILINSAYGYMGAPHLALFADQHAADEVTRRGRELLQGVVASLRTSGVALIEADTDGVYVAVPEHWAEREERALVTEIAAELPAGIQLEYEGRYQAMFSHEVKNYALLTYDGKLITRGVAFRSRGAVPFAERWLQTALHALLRGDVVGVRAAFLAAVAAVRSGTLPPADLAEQVALTKTPEAYAATRARRPEPVYEALIAADRTTWQAGERIRIYRGADHRWLWLPTDNGPAVAPYDVDHYLQNVLMAYATRLRKAFAPDDFAQIVQMDGQLGLFDRPVSQIEPHWIRCGNVELSTP